MAQINRRTPTWSAIGKSVEECKNMEEVLRASGLDYTVEKFPVYADVRDGEGKAVFREPITNRFVTGRMVGGKLKTYDIISDKYEIIQNRDAFDFVNFMGDEISFEKAGETDGGMVYVIAKLPEVDILGDKFTPHVIFRNGFDGKIKIQAAICPLRIVCQNQFNFAFKNTRNTVTIRHVANAEAKLQEAREILKLSANYMGELNAMAERFAAMRITKERLEKVVDYLFPMPNIESMNAFKRNRLETARAGFIAAHNAEDNLNFRDTAWGLINAYTDFVTHKDPSGKSETRFEGKFVTTTFKVAMNPIIGAIEATA